MILLHFSSAANWLFHIHLASNLVRLMDDVLDVDIFVSRGVVFTI